MSSATAGIYCTISPPHSGAMEDCSIVRVQQLQMLYRRRCCISVSQRMFGLLWNISHRSQARSICTTASNNECPTRPISWDISSVSLDRCSTPAVSENYLIEADLTATENIT